MVLVEDSSLGNGRIWRAVHPDVVDGFSVEGDFGAWRRPMLCSRWSPGKSADHSPSPRGRLKPLGKVVLGICRGGKGPQGRASGRERVPCRGKGERAPPVDCQSHQPLRAAQFGRGRCPLSPATCHQTPLNASPTDPANAGQTSPRTPTHPCPCPASRDPRPA